MYTNFDSFLYEISYFSTWSTAFGIWKADFNSMMKKEIELDKMFPHTSLLFSMYEKNEFIVDNSMYFDNQDVGKKGGYNLPETFGTRYLGMCETLLNDGKISDRTYLKIKEGILNFIANWYVNITYFSEKYTFSFDGWEDIVEKLFGYDGVAYIKDNLKQKKIKTLIRKLLKK